MKRAVLLLFLLAFCHKSPPKENIRGICPPEDWFLAILQGRHSENPLDRASKLLEDSYPNDWPKVEQAFTLLENEAPSPWRSTLLGQALLTLGLHPDYGPIKRLNLARAGFEAHDGAIAAIPNCAYFRLRRLEAHLLAPNLLKNPDTIQNDINSLKNLNLAPWEQAFFLLLQKANGQSLNPQEWQHIKAVFEKNRLTKFLDNKIEQLEIKTP